jgi:uncharacterized protein YhfF
MKFPEIDGLRTMELGTPGAMRAELNALVIAGRKVATAGTTNDYVDNAPEHVGEQLVLVDDNVRRVGLIEVTNVVDTTFGAVPWSFAQAEGEGFTSIEHWRAVHEQFWRNEGVPVSDDLGIHLIYFRYCGA